MKPKYIYLIRHGFSEANENKQILNTKPDYACTLTDKGKQQALEAGLKLKEIIGDKPVACYCSPFWRARQTYIQLQKNLNIVSYNEDPRIREQEFGTRINHLSEINEKERDGYGHFYYRLHHGESASDCYDRVSDFIGSLFREFEKDNFPENVLIVNHGLTLRVFLMRWLKLTVEQFEMLRNPANCEYHILELQENGKYKLITVPRLYEKPTHEYQFNWEEELKA